MCRLVVLFVLLLVLFVLLLFCMDCFIDLSRLPSPRTFLFSGFSESELLKVGGPE